MKENVGLNEILMEMLQTKTDCCEAVLHDGDFEFTLNIFMMEIKKKGEVVFKNKNIIEEGEENEEDVEENQYLS